MAAAAEQGGTATSFGAFDVLAPVARSSPRVPWNEMMAANLFSILPVLIVYFLAQNKLIGGIASVGLKG